jgi:hypothetical protein
MVLRYVGPDYTFEQQRVEINNLATDVVGLAVTPTYSTTAGYASTAGISSALTSTANINTSGIITAASIKIGTSTTFTEDLVVGGDARITGILTIGTGTLILDGNDNKIIIGAGVTLTETGDANYSGILTANSFSGSGTNLTGIVTSIVAGTNVTVSGSTGQVTINATGGGGGSSQWVTTDVGIHTLSNVGIGTTNPTSKLSVVGNVLVSGVVTATSFSGDGSLLTGITATGGSSTASIDLLEVMLFS